ncbi:DUF5615 family PIN-like protein [Desulforudis sp. DRI-14]|uniref:DUF5615 family PIN-like protein n=1 Tax=Desulforudis sp. DRI-14 TaxID=3459793 RepID=UPI004041C757
MKLLIDMPLSPGLAERLTREGYDAIHAVSLGLDRAPDAVILDHARREGRIVITA